jgi:hypothetical protein
MPILIKTIEGKEKEIEVNEHMMKCHENGLLPGYKLKKEPQKKKESDK